MSDMVFYNFSHKGNYKTFVPLMAIQSLLTTTYEKKKKDVSQYVGFTFDVTNKNISKVFECVNIIELSYYE